MRFDDALRVLSEREFFISEERIMAIIRRMSREGKDRNIKPLPKVKVPRLTAAPSLNCSQSYDSIADSSCSVNEKVVSKTLI